MWCLPPPTKLLNPPNPIPREELFPFIQTLQPLGWTFHLIYYTAGQGNKGEKKKNMKIFIFLQLLKWRKCLTWGDNLPNLIKPHNLQHSFHSTARLPVPLFLSTVYPCPPILQMKSKHPPEGNVRGGGRRCLVTQSNVDNKCILIDLCQQKTHTVSIHLKVSRVFRCSNAQFDIYLFIFLTLKTIQSKSKVYHKEHTSTNKSL